MVERDTGWRARWVLSTLEETVSALAMLLATVFRRVVTEKQCRFTGNVEDTGGDMAVTPHAGTDQP